MSLKGKLALITGAASGIGKATCAILSRDGATIIAADQNAEGAAKIIQPLPINNNLRNLAIGVQVENAKNVEQAFETIAKTYEERLEKQKPIDILVNCAGIIRDNYLLKISERDFDDVLGVNLKGTFLMTQNFVRLHQNFATMQAPSSVINDVSIVNISSVVGGKLGNVGQTNYAASKSGVIAFTQSAAKELGRFGIRVNAVMPGLIVTSMTDGLTAEHKDAFKRLTSLGRLGKAEEIGEVIAFLASEKSSYITGASIEVTGGI